MPPISNDVSRVVYTSAPQADTSTLPVAPEHLATEQYLASADVDHVLLRNNWYTENYASSVETAAATGSVLTSAGDGRVASAARQDFAEAAAVILTTDGPVKRVYELAGDVAWTHSDLAAALAEVLGKPVEVANVSGRRAVLDPHFGWSRRRPHRLHRGVSTPGSSQGDLELATGDLSALIGRPTTPIAETLRALA